ncbi:hypothetical protein EDB84DRAFT_1634555 [Lactarius hengduanensis]|nr:hypothetical protein EDB84DRAFT_1634555 [Lactarius hengduanensis]
MKQFDWLDFIGEKKTGADSTSQGCGGLASCGVYKLSNTCTFGVRRDSFEEGMGSDPIERLLEGIGLPRSGAVRFGDLFSRTLNRTRVWFGLSGRTSNLPEPLPLRWVIVIARALLIIVTESTVAELPVVDNGLVSGVEAGVIGVEGEVRNEVVVVDEELVKLVELVGIVLDVDKVEVCRVSESLTEELEIEEDDELEAIKLESEETCGEGVGEEEELGDGVEEVLQKGKYAAESGPSRSGSLAADVSSSSHVPQQRDNEHDGTKEGA